jgi:hypothetical protein
MTHAVSRRTILKGLGITAGATALGVSRPQPTEADILGPASPRCYIYLEHAASNAAANGGGSWLRGGGQWIVSALLTPDPRLPRQLLQRTKRHRLPPALRAVPEIEATGASESFLEYIYKLVASPQGEGLEAYNVRVNQTLLRRAGEEVGLLQLRIIRALLLSARPWRFQEVFVYHNLPSLQGVSEDAFRSSLQGIRVPQWTTVRVWEHDSAWDQGPPPPGYPQFYPDDCIQSADFIVHAFFERYQNGNTRWSDLLRPIVRRDFDARWLTLLGLGS